MISGWINHELIDPVIADLIDFRPNQTSVLKALPQIALPD